MQSIKNLYEKIYDFENLHKEIADKYFDLRFADYTLSNGV